MTDTHTHLYMPEYGSDTDLGAAEPVGSGAVRRAVAQGVDRMIFPAVDAATAAAMADLHRHFKDNTYVALGLHPTEVSAAWRDHLELILETGSDLKPVAIGEIGMDLYWDSSHCDLQMQAFEYQCRMAVDRNLPVIIHCREGLDQTLEVLEGLRSSCGVPSGVFHSFGGTSADVERIRNLGDFYFGINGVVTFKNSRLPDTLGDITPERILLETDSPYLSPAPFRGKRNESGRLPLIAARIADVFGMELPRIVAVTDLNADRLFGLNV